VGAAFSGVAAHGAGGTANGISAAGSATAAANAAAASSRPAASKKRPVLGAAAATAVYGDDDESGGDGDDGAEGAGGRAGGRGAVAIVVRRAVDPRALEDPGPHDARWCRHCRQVKPPRCHHCSFCGRCVAKMDHHCPWVGNCVGFGNYKCFVLVLLHGFIASTFSLLLWAPLALGVWWPLERVADGAGSGIGALGGAAEDAARAEANARFLFGRGGISAIFGFSADASLCGSLLLLGGMHAWLLATNRSTLESQWRGPNPYDLGSLRRNVESVLGTRPLLWLWPDLPAEAVRASRAGTEWRRSPPPLEVYPAPEEDEEEEEDAADEEGARTEEGRGKGGGAVEAGAAAAAMASALPAAAGANVELAAELDVRDERAALVAR
jgi:hypothetical protein